MATIEQRVTALESWKTAHVANNAKVATDVTTLKSQMTSVLSRVQESEDAIEQDAADITSLETDFIQIQTKIATLENEVDDLEARVKDLEDGIPVPPPPPPTPTLSVTQTLPSGTVSGTFVWNATTTGTDSVIKVDFLVDGVVKATDFTGPYSYSFDTTTLVNGTHSFYVIATGAKVSATSTTVSLSINNVAPPPPPPPTGNPAFGTRPAHAPYSIDGGTSVNISNVSIDGGSLNSVSGIGITIKNVNGSIVIQDVDLADLIGGIYLYNCTGTLAIKNVRSRNMGDGSIGAGHSNHIQLAECSFSGVISGNQFLGGHTEDMVSTWHSGGKGLGQELIIENNRLQGLVTDTATARAYISGSGTGIIISDGAGSSKNGYIIVRNNTLRTPGQVGIQHIDGKGLQTYGNIIYGDQHPKSNNPATSWEGTPVGEFHHNKYYWKNPSGGLVAPWFGGGVNPQINAHDNVQDATIDPNALVVDLH